MYCIIFPPGFGVGGAAGSWQSAASMSQSAVSPAPRKVALFDLDGTLLAWDCQLLFRHFVSRRAPWRVILLPLYLASLPAGFLLGKDFLKRAFLGYLAGADTATLAAWSKDFATGLLPAFYPELRDAIARHRDAGDFLILSSASPECYVEEIGRLLGFDLALGTVVRGGGLLPGLVNHKGKEKVARLRRELPASWFANDALAAAHGYTDSRADLPMLALCQAVTVVHPDPELAAMAHARGWTILRPPRPWKSGIGFALRSLALLMGMGGDPAGLKRPTAD